MLLVGLLLFIILLIVFTGNKDGAGGGGQFDFFVGVTSVSAECSAPYDPMSTEQIDLYACNYDLSQSLKTCTSFTNFDCSNSVYYSLSRFSNTEIYQYIDGQTFLVVNVGLNTEDSITADQGIVSFYPEYANYSWTTELTALSMFRR